MKNTKKKEVRQFGAGKIFTPVRALVSGVLVFSAFMAGQISIFTPSASAASVKSSILLNISSDITQLNVMPTASGNFNDSGNTTINVKTNNFTGYTLRIAASNSTDLVNESRPDEKIPSISTPVSQTDFSSASGTAYNNKWGFKPSQYITSNGNTNTTVINQNNDYLPSPTKEGMLLDITNTPSNDPGNTYTYSIGARVNNELTAGTYSASFVVQAVSNNIVYNITYDKNTTGSVDNMPVPNPQSAWIAGGTVVAESYAILSDATPTREGYTFAGWCDARTIDNQTTGDQTCEGNTYPAGAQYGIDQTADNENVILYAIWTANTYNISLNGNGATSTNHSTIATATYHDNILSTITVPERKYTISGFTAPSGNNADGVVVNNGTTPSPLVSQYTFNGWYLDDVSANNNDNTKKIASNAATPALQASTIYTNASGQWTYIFAPPTTVTLYAGWGAGQAKTLPTITKTGYTCGWTETATGATTITYASGASITPTSNMTLYGICKVNSYTQTTQVRYENADGTWGSYSTVESKSVNYGNSYSWSTSQISGFDSTTYQAASVASYTVTGAKTNSVSIYRNTFTCSKRYRLQAADGTWGSYTADGSVTARYGGSCSYSKTVTDYKGSSSGANGSAGSASASNVAAATTLSISMYRNTYALTINRNTTAISSVSGAGTYRWGQSVSIGATPAAGYRFGAWSQTAGTTGTIASPNTSSTTFAMGKGIATLYADGKGLSALLDTGPNINTKMKNLANNTSSARIWTTDTKIQSIARSNSLPTGFTPSTNNTITLSTSPAPVYIFFDDTTGTMYYYSEIDDIRMNSNSSNMFTSLKKLTDIDDASNWNTSSVTNMDDMFSNASSLTNIDALAGWNTGSVTDMSNMFGATSLTNIDALADWDTGSVTDMSNMFGATSLTNIDALAGWDTSSVKYMDGMFSNASSLTNIDALSGWDTSSVTDMSFMFYNAFFLTNIDGASKWDTSSVMYMSNMFFGASSLTNIDALADWDTSSVKYMNEMFYDTSSLTNIDALAGWNTSSVKNMDNMFSNASSLTNIDALAGWNTGSVTDMSSMFFIATSLTNIDGASNWDTSSVEDMSMMFLGASSLTNIDGASKWDTSSVMYMNEMFFDASSLTNIDALAGWNTGSVTNMSNMFGATSLTNIDALADWDTSSVEDMSEMFSDATSLTNIDGASNWDTSSVEDMSRMFYLADDINATVLNNWDVSNVTDKTDVFTCPVNMRPSWY